MQPGLVSVKQETSGGTFLAGRSGKYLLPNLALQAFHHPDKPGPGKGDGARREGRPASRRGACLPGSQPVAGARVKDELNALEPSPRVLASLFECL